MTEQLAAHGFSPDDAPACAAALSLSPGRAATASLFVDLGSCKFLDGDLDGAMAAWRQAITSDHDAAAARALLNMGLMYEHLHLFDRATSVLDSVAERAVAPHDVHAALALARCRQSDGALEAATETVARVAATTMAERPQSPQLPEILLALGDLAKESDRPDRAERSWRVAVAGADSPARRAAAGRLLELSLEQGHDDEFVELLATADHADSTTGVVLDRAAGLLRLGHEDRALEMMASLEDAALSSGERFRLADLRIHVGQVNEAIDQLETLIVSAVPEIWQRAAFTLGTLYSDYDMPEIAAEMFERVRSHRDRYWAPKASLAQGDLHAIAGDRSSAEFLWTVAADCDIAAICAQGQSRLRGGVPVESTVMAEPAVEPAEDASAAGAADIVDATAARDDADELPFLDTAPAAAGVEDSNQASLVEDRSDDSFDSEPVEYFDLGDNDLGASDLGASDLDEGDGAEGDRVEMPEPEVIVLADLEAQSRAPVEADQAVIQLPNSEPKPQPQAALQSAPVSRAHMRLVPPLPTEPAVVQLEDLGLHLESDLSDVDDAGSSVFARLSDLDRPVELSDETGRYFDGGVGNAAPAPNPYAALAPDGFSEDPVAGPNPYAELAPSYRDDYVPSADVEAGDWESMLDEWPLQPEDPDPEPPSAFSRYT